MTSHAAGFGETAAERDLTPAALFAVEIGDPVPGCGGAGREVAGEFGTIGRDSVAGCKTIEGGSRFGELETAKRCLAAYKATHSA